MEIGKVARFNDDDDDDRERERGEERDGNKKEL